LQRYLKDQNFDNRKGGLTEQDPDIQFDSKGVEFGPWLRRFVMRVKSNWLIPLNAMSESGRVVITFYVMKDGTIRDLQIVRPSSVGTFNTAALNALKLSNPTLPLPDGYPDDRAFFTVTFHYNDGIGL
jgi:TonB family protein